jgi:hypothetical protein
VHDVVAVFAHPSFHLFILDQLDELPGDLVEKRLRLGDINDREHHPAHICAGHADVIHGFDASDSFNDR